ncbi:MULTISPECIES: DUF3343 domain-containing protein [unclassified Clostridium]|uniref:DUF3343 domain-containing protein n=1 Tax=unclassified Clostridium TaxID=2614128 RepID=UPI000EDBEE00|nr:MULTISPECIES: DUF3343 domain-containing protein [unclassified Clostridium]HCQ91620.1 hypothetical protein [Clostridium sp.]
MDSYYILVFNNTHEAMKAESGCVEAKIKATMMPTPSYITKSCGISLRVDENGFSGIKELINEEKINVKSIFKKEDSFYTEVQF